MIDSIRLRVRGDMKVCHAVALALVGWYLIFPPRNPNRQTDDVVNVDAPYSEWNIMDSFDTADACRSARDGVRQWSEHNKDCTSKIRFDAYLCLRQVSAICISVDDPRLK